MLYIITHKNKPVTIYNIYEIEKNPKSMTYENSLFISGLNKQACIDIFIHHFGFTWKEHKESGFGVAKFKLVK